MSAHRARSGFLGVIFLYSHCNDYHPFRYNETPQILALCVQTRAKAGWDVL